MLTLTIESLDVNTEDMKFGASFNLSCKWFENRATYVNLKNQTSLNYLEGVNNTVWSPTISFSNSIDHSTTIDDEHTRAYVIKMMKHYEKDQSVPESGTENA